MDLFWQITIVEFLLNIAVFAAAAIAYGHIRGLAVRFAGKIPQLEGAAVGVLFGSATVIALLMPIHLNGGASVGGQTVLLALAGPLGGWEAALCSGAIALGAGVFQWTNGSALGATAIGPSLNSGRARSRPALRAQPAAQSFKTHIWISALAAFGGSVRRRRSDAALDDARFRGDERVRCHHPGIQHFGGDDPGNFAASRKAPPSCGERVRESEMHLSRQTKELAAARDTAEAASGEKRVPREYEPRNPHADERHARHERLLLDIALDAEQRKYAEACSESGEAL